MKEVLLFSGGIDSFVAWFVLKKPEAIYFKCNNRYQDSELDHVIKICFKYNMKITFDNTFNFSSIENKSGYIPNRNLHFIAKAAINYDTIYCVGILGDNVSDKSIQFFSKLGTLLSASLNKQIKVTSPFWGLSKTEIVKRYIENFGSKGDLLDTYSCYSKKYGQCGVCKACFRRWVSFELNNIEQTWEVGAPWESSLVDYYRKKFISDNYVADRIEDTRKALLKKGIIL